MTARPRRLAARFAALVLPVSGMLALAAAPAHAGTGVPGVLGAPSVSAPSTMSIDIVEIPHVGFHICTTGIAARPGTWMLAVDGVRSTGSTIGASRSAYGASWTTNNCVDVTENLAPAGEFTLRFTFSDGDVTYARAGGGTWDLVNGEHSWDTGY